MVLKHVNTKLIRAELKKVLGINEHGEMGKGGTAILQVETLSLIKAKLLMLGCQVNARGSIFVLSENRRCTLVIGNIVYQLYKDM